MASLEQVGSYIGTAVAALGLGRAWQWLATRERRIGAEATADARVDVAREDTAKHALDALDGAHQHVYRSNAALVDCEKRTAAAESRAARAEERCEALEGRFETLEQEHGKCPGIIEAMKATVDASNNAIAQIGLEMTEQTRRLGDLTARLARYESTPPPSAE
jgi:uncharacterized coiled-coil protein SlyX